MQYNAEDLSPVKKKISVTIEPQEVEAAIMGAVALYKRSAQIDGFRKGKAPASVVEKRFHTQLYDEARQDLINVHINDVIQKLSLSPVSGIHVEGADAPLERGKGYAYSFEFEVLPTFDLPPYEGMEVEQEKVVADPKHEEQVISRILRERAELVPVEGSGPAEDGQVAVIDFETFENGQPLEGFKAESFNLALGEHQALEDFEKLVKTIPYGGEGEGEITFPEDFLSKDLAGKTVTMKVKVHAIKKFVSPELTDDLCKSLGFETVEKLKETIAKSYMTTRESLNRSAAQKTLLDNMLKMCSFPLPESIVETQTLTLLSDMAARLERQGRRLDSLGKNEEELRTELKPRAEELARSQVLLLSIAKKEGLEVSDKEVNSQIFREAQRDGEDFNQRREQYERSGLIFILRDRLLADKAMDLVYAKAKVTEIEPKDDSAQDKTA